MPEEVAGFPPIVSSHPGVDEIGEGCRISPSVTVMRYGQGNMPAISFGCGVVLFDDTRLVVGDVSLSGKSYIKIGCDVIVNVGCYLSGEGGLDIGHGVLIGPHVKIFSAGHEIYDNDDLIRNNPINFGKIVIGKGAWIGGGATVLQGVSIGEGSVIGAGSVVTHNVPDFAVVVGNPAVVVNYRGDSQSKPFSHNRLFKHVRRFFSKKF